MLDPISKSRRSGCLLFPAPSGGRIYLDKLRGVACFFLHLQERGALYEISFQISYQNIYKWPCMLRPLKMKFTYPSPGSCSFKIYMRFYSKSVGVVVCFFLHLQEGGALWNWPYDVHIYIILFLVSWGFQRYLPFENRTNFPAPSGGRSPLELENLHLYKYIGQFRRVIHTYTHTNRYDLWLYLFKIGLSLFFSAPSGWTVPFGNIFRINMVMASISKTLRLITCFYLHLQEGDALWKWNILIQVPWVM